jgi:hypothetical protein
VKASTDRGRFAERVLHGVDSNGDPESVVIWIEANETLEDDFTVSERDGHAEHVRPFTRDELLKPLEAWFFGRS